MCVGMDKNCSGNSNSVLWLGEFGPMNWRILLRIFEGSVLVLANEIRVCVSHDSKSPVRLR